MGAMLPTDYKLPTEADFVREKVPATAALLCLTIISILWLIIT
jgi:hypothetical protein